MGTAGLFFDFYALRDIPDNGNKTGRLPRGGDVLQIDLDRNAAVVLMPQLRRELLLPDFPPQHGGQHISKTRLIELRIDVHRRHG